MPVKRPTSVEEMAARLENFFSQESLRQGLSFRPRPSDVFIATYPKCGTTWLQQIAHGLRTRGDMNFREITEVVPWLEVCLDLGMDPNGEQRAEPRLFKSHLTWDLIPKGGKYICVVRDPKDVLISQYHIWEGWFFERGTISLEDSARAFFTAPQLPLRYWNHILSWWPQRNNPNVLLLSYESMKQDSARAVEAVAEFLGVPLDQPLREIVLRQSSIAFMKQHADQFDDHLVRNARDEIAGLPQGGDSSKVRDGNVGNHRTELSTELSEQLDTIWRDEVTPSLGFTDYQAMRTELDRR